jgi:hypothetical protein
LCALLFFNIWKVVLIDFCVLNLNSLEFLENKSKMAVVGYENWFLVFDFQKMKFFKNFFHVLFSLKIRTKQASFFYNPKWRREPRWRISVDLFLKNCNKSQVKYFSFQKNPNFDINPWSKKNSKWRPKIKMSSDVPFFT